MDIRTSRGHSDPVFEKPSGSTVPATRSARPAQRGSALGSQLDGLSRRDKGNANHLFLRLPPELRVAVIERMAPDSRKQVALAHKSFAKLAEPALRADLAQKREADAVLKKIGQLGDDPDQFKKILLEVQKLEKFFQTGPLAKLAGKLFRNEPQTRFDALMGATVELPPEYQATVLAELPSELLRGYLHVNFTRQRDEGFHKAMDNLREMVAALPPEHQPKGIVGLAKATAFPGNEVEFEQLQSMVATLPPQHQAVALPGLIKAICEQLPPLSSEPPAWRSSLPRFARRAEHPEIAALHAFQRQLGAGKRGEGPLWDMVKALPDVHRSSALTALADIFYFPEKDRYDGFSTVLELVEKLPSEYQAKPLAKLASNAGTFTESSHDLLKQIVRLTKNIPKQYQRPVLDELKKEMTGRVKYEPSYNTDLQMVDEMLGKLALP